MTDDRRAARPDARRGGAVRRPERGAAVEGWPAVREDAVPRWAHPDPAGDVAVHRRPGPWQAAGDDEAVPEVQGAGSKEVLYTRCTSFVGAMEDRNGLERWMKRTVLVGLAADLGTAEDVDACAIARARVRDVDPDDREALDALADEAFTLGEGYEKAQKGTDLHALTERGRPGEPLGDVRRRIVGTWRHGCDCSRSTASRTSTSSGSSWWTR